MSCENVLWNREIVIDAVLFGDTWKEIGGLCVSILGIGESIYHGLF
jgi:hypothetical protein